jgi:hypothetical protein
VTTMAAAVTWHCLRSPGGAGVYWRRQRRGGYGRVVADHRYPPLPTWLLGGGVSPRQGTCYRPAGTATTAIPPGTNAQTIVASWAIDEKKAMGSSRAAAAGARGPDHLSPAVG